MQTYWETIITPNTLELHPERYHRSLEYCINNNINIKELINKKIYNTWYSNHLLCLSYLVGDLEHIPNQNESFYGSIITLSNKMNINLKRV